MTKWEPKVAHVETEKYNGLLNDTKAVVTTEDGRSAEGYGNSKPAAIEDAVENIRWSRKLWG